MNKFKLDEIKRQRNRADYESHKFNSGYNDKGLIKSAIKAKAHESLKFTNTAAFETHRALHLIHGEEKLEGCHEHDLNNSCIQE